MNPAVAQVLGLLALALPCSVPLLLVLCFALGRPLPEKGR